MKKILRGLGTIKKMIVLKNKVDTEPYITFYDYFDKAVSLGQEAIEAVNIASYDKNKNEVSSRFVNLKYVIKDEWIFFSNYNSPKSKSFETFDQISAILYWKKIDLQIRIKAKIKRTDSEFSDNHFKLRSAEKNAIAIGSCQSEYIKSYEDVVKNFNKTLNYNHEDLFKRPEHWGGFSFTPFYFEFWEGHESRINKRTVFEFSNNYWNKNFLQP